MIDAKAWNLLREKTFETEYANLWLGVYDNGMTQVSIDGYEFTFVPTQELRDFLNGVYRGDFEFKQAARYK